MHHLIVKQDCIVTKPPRYFVTYRGAEPSPSHYPLFWVLVWAFWFCYCDLDVITSVDIHELCARCVLLLININGETFRDSNLCVECFKLNPRICFSRHGIYLCKEGPIGEELSKYISI